MNFVSLHNHTYASNDRFKDSINWPDEMVEKAIRLGFKGMAFTDHESLSAAIEILKVRDSIQKEHPDFKIIFGNEIYLIDEKEVHTGLICDEKFGGTNIDGKTNYYHFILLAKDSKGWEQLKILSSRAWLRSYKERSQTRVPTTYSDIEEIIGSDKGHIIASTACLGSYLDKAILSHKVKEANSFIKWCIDTFGKENFNLEMQPSDSEEQIQVNKTLLKMAKHYDVPYIITTDSHYLDKEDFDVHKIFLNSKLDSDRETEKFYKYTYVMEEQEMVDLLHLSDLTDEEIQEGFENTCAIGDRVEVYDFRHGTIVPKIRIPEFKLEGLIKGKGYPVIDKFYDSKDEQDRYLMFQIERGLKTKKRWELQNQVIDGEVVQNYVATNKPLEINNIILERINRELDILDFISERLNERLSAYLNLTVNIVDIAWQVSLVGPGRGSACGFYINYLIGITQVDPLIYNLSEWRFLNKERVELPKLQHWAV